jgi:serpin B
MTDALHITLPQEQFHPAFNSLDQFLKQRHSDELNLLNALWGSADSTYLEPYLDTLAEDYGAGMRIVDFGEYEGARRAINQWASDETQNRINELLPPGSINKRTDLVLTNALYLNAIWASPFLEEDTRLGDFNRLNGRRVSVPMMSRIGWFSYADLGGVKAVDLTYVGGELSMMVILPEMGGFESFVQGLDPETIGAITKELTLSWLSVIMPKFRFSSALELEDPLRKLGMEDAFSHTADFSGMDGTLDLFIDNIYQQTYINVNEDGTEAGSATAVVEIPKGGIFSHPIEFVVDRPFIFLIRDIETGAILFLGHVVDPKPED